MSKTQWIYWTGGYDSTFLICYYLVTSSQPIQPVYLLHCDVRDNTDVEMAAMNKIRALLAHRFPRNISRLAPTLYIDCRQVPLDADITAGMASLCKQGKLTLPKSQYSYMAQIPRLIGHLIDSGSEKGPQTCLSQHVRQFMTAAHTLNSKETPWDVYIFRGMRFPVIYTSKQQMYALAKKHGFADLLHLTQTCRVPIRDAHGNTKPCGKCTLCKERII